MSNDSPQVKALKAALKEKGINFHPRHGEDKLRALLEGRDTYDKQILNPYEATLKKHGPQGKDLMGHRTPLEASVEPSEAPAEETPSEVPPAPVVSLDAHRKAPEDVPAGKLYLTEAEFKEIDFAERKKNANRLVRCRITCMNPIKKGWTGEFISVGSAKVGTFKKFIPFNLDEPYHIPFIIYEHLKEKKCRIGTIRKLSNGREVNEYKLVNEFAIEVLPPLSAQELEDLKHKQALAGGVS